MIEVFVMKKYEEIVKAVIEMANNKSTGSDGLTVEFYKMFYHI